MTLITGLTSYRLSLMQIYHSFRFRFSKKDNTMSEIDQTRLLQQDITFLLYFAVEIGEEKHFKRDKS